MSDEFYEQKIKALEINAKQFYSQLKVSIIMNKATFY